MAAQAAHPGGPGDGDEYDFVFGGGPGAGGAFGDNIFDAPEVERHDAYFDEADSKGLTNIYSGHIRAPRI